MNQSELQEPFLKEIAESFHATLGRIRRRMAESPENAAAMIEDELKGLYHGIFVTIDGGTALADQGLVKLIDVDGVAFDRFLDETARNRSIWKSRLERQIESRDLLMTSTSISGSREGFRFRAFGLGEQCSTLLPYSTRPVTLPLILEGGSNFDRTEKCPS